MLRPKWPFKMWAHFNMYITTNHKSGPKKRKKKKKKGPQFFNTGAQMALEIFGLF